jgi:hypothetical protein
LNGDGTNDNIVVYSNNDYISKTEEPKQYTLKICINNLCYDQIVYFSGNSYYGKQTKFSIININKKDNYKELLVSYKESAMEDPSFNNSIFRYLSNNIVTVSEIFSSGYSNGQINYINDYSFTVDHGRFPDVKGTYVLDDLYVKQSELYTQSESEIDYSKMAACPFVYFLDDDKKVFKGEILRYLNADYTESWQTLNLNIKSQKQKRIRILISEEKDETTYINSLYLLVNGKICYPKQTNQNLNKIIKDDKNYLKLEKGNFIEIEFDLNDQHLDSAILYAKGYYLPIKNNNLKILGYEKI